MTEPDETSRSLQNATRKCLARFVKTHPPSLRLSRLCLLKRGGGRCALGNSSAVALAVRYSAILEASLGNHQKPLQDTAPKGPGKPLLNRARRVNSPFEGEQT
jgi:hypothetical protein